MFETIEEATLVYDKATLKMRGARTFLNFVLHMVAEVISLQLKTNYVSLLAFHFLPLNKSNDGASMYRKRPNKLFLETFQVSPKQINLQRFGLYGYIIKV